ncbi:MAG: 3-deoxy-manno-octulosonate cytidylyltransferase [Verrucomicrobia bacterium]|nr:3-deoxy-manno-octulosonate cytidylyltransferase [Cytophagales bacterium]
MKILGIIPARFASTRFPAKALADIAGKTMIQRVFEQASKAVCLDKIVVATDHERIYTHVKDFGGSVVMTSENHPSGTDRCFEAWQKTEGNFDFVINIQGDEPFISPKQIEILAASLSEASVQMATLITKVTDFKQLADIGEVKVVLNHKQEAMYFSRSMIPFIRNEANPEKWLDLFPFYRHVGMYAYRTDILQAITQLPPSALEKAESLEQLRWLEHGFTIKTAYTDEESICIDMPEDLQKALSFLAMNPSF